MTCGSGSGWNHVKIVFGNQTKPLVPIVPNKYEAVFRCHHGMQPLSMMHNLNERWEQAWESITILSHQNVDKNNATGAAAASTTTSTTSTMTAASKCSKTSSIGHWHIENTKQRTLATGIWYPFGDDWLGCHRMGCSRRCILWSYSFVGPADRRWIRDLSFGVPLACQAYR